MKLNILGLALLTGTLFPTYITGQNTETERAYAAAQKALAAGDIETARKDFEQLSKANPDIAELHATLGAVLFQQGDFTAALKELEWAKRLKPSLPKIDGLIAMSQSELGLYKEALSKLEDTFRTSKDPPIKRMSGLQLERAYTALHQDARATEVAVEMQRLFPDDPEVLYHNERIFGNFAYQTVQKLVAIAPDSVWRHLAQAEAQESQGLHDAAIAEYRQVLTLDPTHPGVHYRIGRCLRERERDSHHPEDRALAMEEFRAELKLDPSNASAAYEIGELHRLAGEMESAKTYFETALRLYPDFPEANLGLGTVLASMNQPAAALPYLRAALAADPEDEASWYRLSQVERSLGHTTEQQQALSEFKRLHDKALNKHLQPALDVSRQQLSGDTPP